MAGQLRDEIIAAILMIPTADGAVSAVLARLRLIGHHLYPCGEGEFAGDADGASPTGLTLQFGPASVDVGYLPRR